jgi:hypothetical protein
MPLHVGGHHADLRDSVLQLLFGDSEMLGPVSQFPSFVALLFASARQTALNSIAVCGTLQT